MHCCSADYLWNYICQDLSFLFAVFQHLQQELEKTKTKKAVELLYSIHARFVGLIVMYLCATQIHHERFTPSCLFRYNEALRYFFLISYT